MTGLEICDGAIVDNIVTYRLMYAKFGDDRLWNEKNLSRSQIWQQQLQEEER